MGRVRRWGPWAALAVVVAVALVVAASREGDRSVDARVDSLASRLACPVCEAESVADSSAAVSLQIRDDLRARVAAGQSDEEILDYYVDQEGEGILLRPRAEGVGLLVYAVPVAVVLAGVVGLGLAVRRWRREPASVPTDDDLVLVARQRAGQGRPAGDGDAGGAGPGGDGRRRDPST